MSEPAAVVLDVEAIQRLLPHRPPFLLVDRVVLLEPGRRLVAWKSVTMNEPFFVGHFPGRPVMPGVLILEALAQAGALFAMKSLPDDQAGTKLTYLMGIDGARFRRPVVPGDRLELEVVLTKAKSTVWKMQGTARVDGQVVAEAEFMAMLADRAAPPSGSVEMAIHPTAVVESGAELDPSCEVGPYAVIGPHVRIGAGTVVGPHAVVSGRTTVGQGNRIFPHAAIGGVPQDLKYGGEPTRLEIGDRNTFREYVTINLGTVGGGGVTVIGNGCLFMANSHVGHDCRVGDGAIVANSVALAGHIVLEDHVHISGLAAAHQFTRIGRLAFVSGLTGVVMDVAPYTTVAGTRAELAGLNTVGLQRAGMTEEQVGRVKQAYKIVFRSNLGLAEAIAQLRAELGGHPEVDHLATFLEGTQRGVTR